LALRLRLRLRLWLWLRLSRLRLRLKLQFFHAVGRKDSFSTCDHTGAPPLARFLIHNLHAIPFFEVKVGGSCTGVYIPPPYRASHT
jgi:hypothetical protein